ncbi:JmjC domain-containing protein [Bacillus safensis]|uniref:JmjC domain-containing protein n=1 Tax=Bacillus safensis TaxID=561879 RepID=UPI000B452A0A|nr:cupin domain-containing protein [Bacillus safensis]PAK35901.1 hypothetical protein CHI04_05295 [Bacillus safensis]UDB52200.1 cupin-like domain-containing protein [Bacillus safensis]
MKITNGNILDDVLNEMNSDEFLNEYWPNYFLHNKGSLERFFSVPGIESISSLENILKIYKNPVMVVGDAIIEETGGILNKFLVPPEEAMSWYEKGAALEFDFTDIFIPELRESINKLKSLLGLPEGTMAKAVLYAAKESAGFSAHFDAYCNFIFQLKGKKKWKLAENFNTVNPLQHYELIEAPHLPDPLKSYWNGEFPDENLSNGTELILDTGSFLFLPRGCWHSTSSSEETIALNFTFGQPAWLDLILIELRNRLIQKEEWRELVNIDLLDENERQKIEEKLKSMINNLPNDFRGISVGDILARKKDDLDVYQSTQLVVRQLMSIKDGF